MKILKNVFGRVFAFWALLCFACTLLLIVIPISIAGFWSEPKRSQISHRIFAGWMTVFFILVGIRRIIRGGEHFKRTENYVIVCNHNSFMDVPLSSGSIPGPNKTIAKIEMARIPLFGIIYKRGSVLVDRKSEQSRKESFGKMKDVLAMGLHMCIYPEGTRNKSGEALQPFHDGAFRLAVDSGKPIIPAVIFHTKTVLPQHKPFYFWPHRVEMHFLPPHHPMQKSAQELKAEVHGEMKKFYEAHR